jgi:hypothetical protein
MFNLSKYMKEYNRKRLQNPVYQQQKKKYAHDWLVKNHDKVKIYSETYRRKHGIMKRDPSNYLYNLKKCRFCGKENIALIKDGRYFLCRECNRIKQKKYYQKYSHKIIEANRIRRQDNQSILQHLNARNKVNYAIKTGKLVKPMFCKCGNPRVQAHHDNYNQPLIVKWMCSGCHADYHRRLTQKLVS